MNACSLRAYFVEKVALLTACCADSVSSLIWEIDYDDGFEARSTGSIVYEFCLEDHVPSDHLLRSINGFVDLDNIRKYLAPFYSDIGRPSIDPELMIPMLLIGYIMGIRSERRLCEEAHLNLAYRWFCRLDLSNAVPDHSTFSKNRHALPDRQAKRRREGALS